MTNPTTISITEIINEIGAINNIYQQYFDIMVKYLYDPEKDELTASQLRRLINLELIKNELPIVFAEQDSTELEVAE
jgi:hypothetical protein